MMIETVVNKIAKPSDEILKKYADVFIKYALNDGEGCQPGEVVKLNVKESAKPILNFLVTSVLECGGIPISNLVPEGYSKNYFENASLEQIQFENKQFTEADVARLDHTVSIISEVDKEELKDIEPSKIMEMAKSRTYWRTLKDDKENSGNYTWTLGLYGTFEMADGVGMTIEEYWQEIVKACYLDEEDPVAKFRETSKFLKGITTNLNDLNIQKVHVEAEGTDITIGIGSNRKWEAGGCRNIPSFEVFTSPHRDTLNGKISFTEPLYRDGNLIKDIVLEFKDGECVSSSASEGEDYLKELLSVEGGNFVGEFSLTDSRISKITKFMGETLYDENVGGPQGNTHIAIGSAYRSCYKGDVANTTEDEWIEMGYNKSAVHTDIVATSKRTVTATLEDGYEIVIYKDGQFTNIIN